MANAKTPPRALTAVHRTGPSAPARHLASFGLIQGRALDYGCGHGADAARYGLDRYDPHWHPEDPGVGYDTILCTYVLNVIDDPAGQRLVLHDIVRRLKPGGRAYITVRRDITAPTLGRSGAWQVPVTLDLPSVYHRRGAFEVYDLRKD